MGVYIGEPTVISDMQGPAPDGFHVPSSAEWVALCGILTTTFSMAKNATTMGTYLKMSMAGYRGASGGNVNSVGSTGYYWSSTPHLTSSAHMLSFSSSSIIQNTGYRPIGYSVRCFKNSPTVPTASWITLYDGSSVASGAGVFWNSTDGLISVSGDGTTWYTIMDKNLGATIVFNQGDTLTDANCGYFYQRGNNYGFPHSGTITTSSTQVDASSYGPGNYYNSSTFIIGSNNRSSVQNDNLWGGVTQGTTTKSTDLKNAYIGEYQGRLPSAYQEVEWIGNSGTQYIDTGIAIPNHKAIANIEYTAFNDWMYLGAYMGPDSGVPGGHLRLYGGRAGTTGQFCYGLLSSYAEYGGSMSLNTKYELEVSMISGNLYFKHDGTTYGTSSATYTTSKAGNYGILAQNNEQSWEVWNSAKVYDYKVYDSSDVLLRDFVPCYRIADSVIGMYELVNGVFYTNQGSGTFTKGADVN